MDTTLLKAVYELRRQEIILAKLNTVMAAAIPDALAFAYASRLCPVFHTMHTTEEDPFDSAYRVSREFANAVLEYCDEMWLKKEKVTFYGLEDRFANLDRGKRMDVYAILRYAFLGGRFDPDFFKGVLSNCPAEAHGLDSPFNVSDEVSLV